MKTKLSIFSLCLGLLSSFSFAQDSENVPNVIRSTAILLANTDQIGPRTQPEQFPTGQSGDSPVENGISYQAFRQQISAAFQEGRGGVVDFEAPLPGGTLYDIDRTEVKAFIQRELRLNPLSAGELLQTRINIERQRAYNQIVNQGELFAVEARNDRSVDDIEDLPFDQSTTYDALEVRYGSSNQSTLMIRRGSQHKVEGALASTQLPGPEALNTVNDNYYFSIGIPGYSGGQNGRASGQNVLSGGMIDLLFDARENVTALGFIATNTNNFQYFQGLQGLQAPNNPNNLIVRAQFSDGSSSVFRGTTNQANGSDDNFFGIQAPTGVSITRLWVRIVGRNFRTFVFLDDFAFITSPAAPYLASPASAIGRAGQPFTYSLSAGQSPTSIDVANLPSGLNYDSESRLISGILPNTPGTQTVEVTLTNEVGTINEQIVLNWVALGDTDRVPQIGEIGENGLLGVTVRSSISQTVSTNFDGTEIDLPSDVRILNFFSRVYPLDAQGDRIPGTVLALEDLGLAISDGIITGTPLTDNLAGTYELEVYVTNASGSDMEMVQLVISPAVIGSNFTANSLGDVALLDANQVRAIIASGEGGFEPVRNLLGVPAQAQLFIEDFNNDGRSDVLVYDKTARQVSLYLVNEQLTTSSLSLLSNMSGNWTILDVKDFDGDGLADILWKDETNSGIALWKMGLWEGQLEVSWAGYIFNDGINREFVISGDLRGQASAGVELLFRRPLSGGHIYQVVFLDSLPATGVAGTTGMEFLITEAGWEPRFVADFSGDGFESLVWVNTLTGKVLSWDMNDGQVPVEFLELDQVVLSPLGHENVVWEIEAAIQPNAPVVPPRLGTYRDGIFVTAGTKIGEVSRRFSTSRIFERTTQEDVELQLWGIKYIKRPGDSVTSGEKIGELIVERVNGESIANVDIVADRNGIIQSFGANEFIRNDNVLGRLQRLEMRVGFHTFQFFTSDVFDPFQVTASDPNLSYRWKLVKNDNTSFDAPTPDITSGTIVIPPGEGDVQLYTLLYYPQHLDPDVRLTDKEGPVPVELVEGEWVEIDEEDIQLSSSIYFAAYRGPLTFTFEQSQGVTFDPETMFSGVAQDGAILTIAKVLEESRSVRMVTLESESADVVAPTSGTLINIKAAGGGLNNLVPAVFSIYSMPDALEGDLILPVGSRYHLSAIADFNNDRNADLVLRERVSGRMYIQLMNSEGAVGSPNLVLDSGTAWQVVGVSDYNGDVYNDLLVKNPTSGELRVLFIDGLALDAQSAAVESETSLGSGYANASIFSAIKISNDLSIPARANAPVAPWTNAVSANAVAQGNDFDRWFWIEGFGWFYEAGSDGYIYHEEHGWLYIVSNSTVSNDVWAWDTYLLTWLWIDTYDTYPWMYMIDARGSGIGNGWIYFHPETSTPNRWFFSTSLEALGIPPEVSEEELLFYLTPQ